MEDIYLLVSEARMEMCSDLETRAGGKTKLIHHRGSNLDKNCYKHIYTHTILPTTTTRNIFSLCIYSPRIIALHLPHL